MCNIILNIDIVSYGFDKTVVKISGPSSKVG